MPRVNTTNVSIISWTIRIENVIVQSWRYRHQHFISLTQLSLYIFSSPEFYNDPLPPRHQTVRSWRNPSAEFLHTHAMRRGLAQDFPDWIILYSITLLIDSLAANTTLLDEVPVNGSSTLELLELSKNKIAPYHVSIVTSRVPRQRSQSFHLSDASTKCGVTAQLSKMVLYKKYDQTDLRIRNCPRPKIVIKERRSNTPSIPKHSKGYREAPVKGQPLFRFYWQAFPEARDLE
ncbi:hypothetical protein IFM89_001000 [Coptis chinensis]|uniref:Uncharacterized protein n=1 Tax=Coptis chinensis TaxID=261450 RepID=A0A835IG82_9MAGN|nr:hypothetical protein IFM89_001000 [Coptis chinensis]